jgi:hypothetical protein
MKIVIIFLSGFCIFEPACSQRYNLQSKKEYLHYGKSGIMGVDPDQEAE